MLSQFEIQQIINYERNRIMVNGQRLGRLKEDAIADFHGHPLPPNYAMQLLQQICIIALHDMNRNNMYGVDRARNRRRNLGNLAITAKLFRDDGVNPLILNNIKNRYFPPGSQEQNTIHQGYTGTNIFDDLAYLCSFNLVGYDNNNPLGRPLYNLTDDQVNTILDEICPALIQIANAEIAAYNNNPPNNLNEIRDRYRYHTNLPELFILTSYHKEIAHIHSAIRAIDSCVELDFDPNAPQIFANKKALLRCLSIVGEAFTRVNLTPATRGFGFLSQRELQFFVNIRDSLAHIEQYNNVNRIEHFIQHAQNLNPIIDELRVVRALLDLIYWELRMKYNHLPNLRLHYLPADKNNLNRMRRFHQIKDLLNAGQAENNHIDRIANELQEIRDLLVIAPGLQTLEAPPEIHMNILIPRDVYNEYRRAVLLCNYNELNLVLVGLSTLAPVVHTNNVEHLIIEINNQNVINSLPNTDIAPYQTLTNLQNNLNDVTNSLTQYGRKLQFINYLQQNPVIKLNIEYHIIKLVQLIGRANPNVLAPEVRVFRNMIAHDHFDEILVMNSIPENFICRYLAILCQMLPGLLQQNQQGVPMPPQI